VCLSSSVSRMGRWRRRISLSRSEITIAPIVRTILWGCVWSLGLQQVKKQSMELPYFTDSRMTKEVIMGAA